MNDWIEGRTLLITGGGAGIGAAIGTMFLKHGGRVLQLGRSPLPEARNWTVDLADAARVCAVLDEIDEPVDFVVNNASYRQVAPLADATSQLWWHTFAVNLFAPMEICRRVAERMPAGGGVVNISSGAARHLSPGTAAYAASQSALEAATVVLAKELAARSIRVNTVAPGPTDTPGLAAAIESRQSLPATELAGRIPLGRLGAPEDVAATVLFLLSPAAGFVTGQLVGVNGGL